MKLKLYHNPRCSKSRQTLALLEAQSADFELVDYLNHPLSEKEINDLVVKLKIGVRDLIRQGESVYLESGLDDLNLSDSELISTIIENPILLQRPIVVADERAVIGRPPEAVLMLFD